MPAVGNPVTPAARILVLASGSGTLLEAILADGIPVSLVVVDRPSRAVEVAEAHGVPAVLVERTSFGDDFDRVAYTRQVVEVLQDAEIDLVAHPPQEFDAWRWADLHETADLVVPFKRDVYLKVVQAFAPVAAARGAKPPA